MKYENMMIITVLLIIFTIASVSASDVDNGEFVSAENDMEPVSSDTSMPFEDTELSASDNDEVVSAENDLKLLSTNPGNYSGLSSEISSGGNVKLQHDYYTYDSGSTISITGDDRVIDGNGAVIDMAGSTIRAFSVSASGVIIKNLTIKNANFDGDGGAIYFSSSGTVENCNFTNNTAKYGGAISVSAEYNSVELTVTDSVFTENFAEEGGGAICIIATYGNAISYNISGSEFTNNSVNYDSASAAVAGGAVYTNGAAAGTILDTSFTGNKAENANGSGNGGAVKVQFGGTSTIENCVFTANVADIGGAISLQANTGFDNDVTVIGCTFTDNKANQAGGAISCLQNVGSSALTVKDSTFTDNTADIVGGSIYLDDLSTVSLSGSNFTDNNASKGGAIYALGDLNLTGCEFIKNTAEVGGAVYFNETCTVTNCNFTNNSAISEGGAVYFLQFGTVENCNFTNNSAANHGGSLYFRQTGTVENCNFTNNKATAKPNGAGSGGAVYFNAANSNVTNCTFTNNTVINGDGGAVCFVSFGSVINCNFINNTASGDSFGGSVVGGAVYFVGRGNVANCTFTNNHVGDGYGGAVYFSADSNVTNCTFTGNAANYMGGAIQFNNFGTVTNCNFINNTAEYYGGAIRFSEAGSVTNCNFVNNNAASDGGAIYFRQTGAVENCNFINNTASDKGGAIYFNNNLGTITNCNFTGNSAPEVYPIPKKQTPINITAPDIMIGEDAIITVSLPDDINGTINITGGNMTITKDFINTITVNISNLEAGNYEVIARSGGNEDYSPNSNSTMFSVLKYHFPINVSANDCFVGENLVVNITSPPAISCNVTLTITITGGDETDPNSPYQVEIINGKGSINIETFYAGIYNITVNFAGNGTYLPSVNNTEVTVSKHKDNLTVTTQKNTDEGYISVTVPADITKNLTLTIDGNAYTIKPGSNKIDLTGLGTGDYAYSIVYPGDDKYGPYSSSDSIHLSKTALKLNIAANDTTYGNGGKITVSLSQNITGSVNFTLLDNESVIDTKTSVVINGTATYLIPELNVGRYTLKAQSAGDTKHYKSDLYSASFKVAPKISITPDVVIGDDGIITMELGDVSGVIAVSVDGELDGSKKIAEGKFIYALSTWVLLVGNHTLTFEYTGNSFDKNIFNYWDNETASYKPIEYRFHIAPKQTETKSDSDNDNLFEIILEDENGTVLSNATGQIVVEIINQFTQEVEHIIIDVVNGIATLDISKFKDGNYLIRWNYLGDGKHTPISKQLTLTITHKPSGISASDLTLLYTSKATYYVTVYTGSGEGISGVPVTFLINNRVVKTVTTDSRGVAGISISQNPGSYHITAKADALRITRILTVTHLLSLKTVKVKKSAKKLVLTASLKKINGKYLKGKKITFKFNGKKYTAKTNKKGVCKLTMKMGRKIF